MAALLWMATASVVSPAAEMLLAESDGGGSKKELLSLKVEKDETSQDVFRAALLTKIGVENVPVDAI